MSQAADRAGDVVEAQAKAKVETRDAGPDGFTRIADRSFGFLVRNNVFYVLSALMMLVGCMLIGIPIPFEFREMWIIAVLVGVINVYEVMVILAASYIARRSPRSRELTVLLLAETVFLLDGHFTVNAGLTTDFRWGTALAALSLVLAFVKIRALERGVGPRVFAGMKTFLFPAVVFMHAIQVALILTRGASPATREVTTYLAWLALGALPMLLVFTKLCAKPDAEADTKRDAEPGDTAGEGVGEAPWWRRRGFALAVALAGLVFPALLLAGQTWAHEAPFEAAFLLPFAFALMAVLPSLLRLRRPRDVDVSRAAIAALLFMIAAGGEGMSWATGPGKAALVLSPFRMDLVFGAFAFLVMWRRERRRSPFNVAFVMLGLAVIGHDGERIAEFLAEPRLARLALCVPLAALWWLRGRGYGRALWLATAFLFMAARAVVPENADACPLLEFIRWWPVVALVLTLVLKRDDAVLRASLVAAVFGFGVGSCFAPDAAGLVHTIAAFIALAAAAVAGGRRYVYVLAAYPPLAGLAAGLAHYRPSLPTSSLGWGAVSIALAFALFGVAFLVTRLGLPGRRDAESGSVPGGGADAEDASGALHSS